jgi:hypothetical protein
VNGGQLHLVSCSNAPGTLRINRHGSQPFGWSIGHLRGWRARWFIRCGW